MLIQASAGLETKHSQDQVQVAVQQRLPSGRLKRGDRRPLCQATAHEVVTEQADVQDSLEREDQSNVQKRQQVQVLRTDEAPQ